MLIPAPKDLGLRVCDALSGTPYLRRVRHGHSFTIVSAISTPEIRDFMTREGAEPVGSTPQEFAAYLRSEIERYAKVAKAASLKVE